MMSAKEMFEELGYEEQFKGSDIYINRKYGSRIAFDDYNGGTIDVVELCYIPRELLKAINMRCKELGWLEEEKTEIKEARNPEVTNFEHYKDRILDCCIDNLIDNLAVVKGRPTLCCETNCDDCDFKINRIGCRETAKYWLKQPYKKPVFKLTKFEKELLECYSDECSFKLFNSLNVMKEKGYFKGIDDNEPIGDILAKCEVVG